MFYVILICLLINAICFLTFSYLEFYCNCKLYSCSCIFCKCERRLRTRKLAATLPRAKTAQKETTMDSINYGHADSCCFVLGGDCDCGRIPEDYAFYPTGKEPYEPEPVIPPELPVYGDDNIPF